MKRMETPGIFEGTPRRRCQGAAFSGECRAKPQRRKDVRAGQRRCPQPGASGGDGGKWRQEVALHHDFTQRCRRRPGLLEGAGPFRRSGASPGRRGAGGRSRCRLNQGRREVVASGEPADVDLAGDRRGDQRGPALLEEVDGALSLSRERVNARRSALNVRRDGPLLLERGQWNN